MNTQVNDPKGAAGALKAPTMAEMAEALRKAVLWGECASRHILYRENINWRYLDEARATLAAHSLHTVKEKPLSPSDATPCSPIVGYRLENGTDKAELYFLPNRLAQKTLDQMADLISDGWMVTGIIYSENESSGGTAGSRRSPAPCSASLPASMRDLLHYEICAAWWPQFVSWGPLQDIIAGHFARKVEKKYRRWKWCVERSQRLSDLILPNADVDGPRP